MADWPSGYGQVWLDDVDSTNAEARRRAQAGAQAPVWIAAKRQSAAKGRRGRAWRASEGNLGASLLLRPDEAPANAALHSFVMALAAADMADVLVPGGIVTLKWPNDLLVNGGKAAGILLESASSGDRVDWLVIGVGVNLAHHPQPEDIEPAAFRPTSLAAEAGTAHSMDHALTTLAAAFARWEIRYGAEGFKPIRAAWRARAHGMNQPIIARLPGEIIEGVFEDMDETGALVLKTGAGQRRISAAEINFV